MAELLDARRLIGDPRLDRRGGIAAAALIDEIEPQLLEIARQAGGQQPFPLVGGLEMLGGIVRPIEPERFAEA